MNYLDKDHETPGPYRIRYAEAYRIMAEHSPGRSKLHLMKHGKLCMEKLLLENLWIEWQMDQQQGR